jgi:hypothetical protein
VNANDDLGWSMLGKGIGLGSWLLCLTVVLIGFSLIAPISVLALPMAVGGIAAMCLREARNHECSSDEQERDLVRGIELTARLRAGSLGVALVALPLILIGGTACATGLALVLAWVLVLTGVWRKVFGRLDAAGVPRVIHAEHAVRDALHYIHLDGVVLRGEGSSTLPKVFLAALVALPFGVIGQVAGPAAAQSAVVSAFPAAKLFFPGHVGASPPPETPPNAGASPTWGSGAVNSPTALPQSPCPRVDQVLATMSTGVSPSIGSMLFRAWEKIGGAVIGCPDAPPRKVGQLWVQSLTNGRDTPSQVVYGRGTAAVILSDLYGVTLEALPSTAWVDARIRWGLGTLQLLHLRDRTCRLGQRYEQDDNSLLAPAALTAAVINIGHLFGAVPWVKAQQRIEGGYAYEVHFIAPGDAGSAFRDLRTITFRYQHGRVYRTDTESLVASDGMSCPSSFSFLPATAAQVEGTVQAGHG